MPWDPSNPAGEPSNFEEAVNAVNDQVNAGKAITGHGTTGTTAMVGVNPGTPTLSATPAQGITGVGEVAVAFVAGIALWKQIRSRNRGSGGCD
jgi:hypothetical protein